MSHDNASSVEEMRDGVWTIVVAGGSGLRFGERKQFVELAGRSVLQRSVDAATASSTGIVVVVPADVVDEVVVQSTAELVVVAGGSSRAESVRRGLTAVPDQTAIILVHDAARPLASAQLFDRVVDAVRKGAVGVVPAVPLADTIRSTSGGVVDRSTLLAVQTPQGFAAEALRAAHETNGEATDDASLVESLGHTIETVQGDAINRKLTEPTDLVSAEALIAHVESQS